MKKIILLLSLITLISCKNSDDTSIKTEPQTTQFDWLEGKWVRTNDKDGEKTFENWTKKSNSEFLGISYKLQKADTIWKENVKLSKTKNSWIFAVTGVEDKTPIVFNLSKIDDRSFTFENKKNSFPKLICYKNKGNKFEAIVSGDDMKILFEFEKQN